MNLKMKRIVSLIICLAVVIAFSSGLVASASTMETASQIKNVILMIPDGMSVSATTLARWYNDGAPLALDEIASGLVKTYWSGGPITDSAPAATALATGFKAADGTLSILPDKVFMPNVDPVDPKDAMKPIATVLEGAKLQGKSTGLVATSPIMHATPAAFSSHEANRNNFDAIAEQQVYSNIDVMLGSGARYLDAQSRADKEDLLSIIKQKGYNYVTTASAMMKASSGKKLWGMFGKAAYEGYQDTSMKYDMDRDTELEPSLAEMTDKAIKVLSRNEKGFFLMVEGSKIDWAAHANDPIGVISDVLAFDNAVRVALDFAKKDGHTAVIACTDHGNGGISIGNADTTSGYNKLGLSTFLDPIKKAKLTGEGLESVINANKSNIKEVMSTYFGITDLTADEETAIKAAAPGRLNYTVGPMISKRARIGWTTGGHTGEDVVLYCYASNGDKLSGVIENTDIAKYMARVLGIDLQNVNDELYIPAVNAFAAIDAEVSINKTNPANPVVVVTRDGKSMKLPVNKNIAVINSRKYELPGLTLISNETAYVCQEAADLFDRLVR